MRTILTRTPQNGNGRFSTVRFIRVLAAMAACTLLLGGCSRQIDAAALAHSADLAPVSHYGKYFDLGRL